MEKQFIELGEIQLAYEEQNPERAHTIFFIHGSSGSSETWLGQLNDPAFDRYRLIAIDLPGYGESDGSRDKSLPGTAKILGEAIERLLNSESYSFVGTSEGANLATEVLSTGLQPKGLVMISPELPNIANKYSDEIALLSELGIKILVVFGENDSPLKTAYLEKINKNYWRNKVFKFPGSGHAVHRDKAADFNHLLIEYLEEMINRDTEQLGDIP